MLQPGDLLFQDLGMGQISDAISDVTPGFQGAEISHVGLYAGDAGGGVVIEAIYPVVRFTALKRYLNRSKDEQGRPCVFASRLRNQMQLAADAVEYAQQLVGLPYDRVFGSGEDAYYCSELLVDAFKRANGGVGIFEEHPMNFRNPQTGEVPAAWRQYFAWLGVDIPEGEFGSNPGEMSLSTDLELVYQFGSLEGWVKP